MAGGGPTLGDTGLASSAMLSFPSGAAVDAAGNVYIADTVNNRIREVSGGVITTVAGNGAAGYNGDNIPATSAQLHSPWSVAVDSSGNLYIGDTLNYRVRKVSNGVITTLAGTGTLGYNGDNIQANTAQLGEPYGVAVDATGNVYIADTWNNRIRKVSGGIITTFAGTGDCCSSGDNGPAVSAKLNYPTGVAVHAAGIVYIADTDGNTVRRVAANGIISTIAGGGNTVGDNGPATAARLSGPSGIALDAAGNIFVADPGNGRIRALVPSNAPACSYSLDQANWSVAASGGSVTIAVQTGWICAWTVTGLPTWIAASGASSGSGPASVTLAVAANSGAQRTASLTIGGVAVQVTQDAFVPPTPVPSIAAVTIAPDGNIHAIQINSWVAIWGSNLAPAGSGRTWGTQDIVDGRLPLSLDGVSATINGKPAYVEYISPTQVNVLAPPDAATGAVNVVLTNAGVASAPFSVQLQTYSPAFFTFGPPIQRYIAGYCTKSDGAFDAYVAPVGAFGSDVPSRPAKPGDTVVLFGTGFGPTSPAPPVGQVFYGAYPTTTPVTATVGGVSAVVQWAGISAAGVYQFNVTVPSVADGDARVVATVGGSQSEDTLFIPVQR
ncbi:MAG: BACON domain-containing carbohydrate-binding protein [Bryobacteraceae bacterium]